MAASILRSIVIFPLTAGHTIVKNFLHNTRDGKISSIVLTTSIISVFLASSLSLTLGGLFKRREKRLPEPNNFLWGLYSFKNLASFCCVLTLCIVLGKKPHYLLKRKFDYSITGKMLFLWMFGIGYLLHPILSVCISVKCIVERGIAIYRGEEMLGILSRVIAIAFIVTEMIFVTYFRKHKLLSTKLTNYCVYFTLASNLTEWFKTTYFHLKSENVTKNFSGSAHQNSCYVRSEIRKFEDNYLEPYLVPVETEYSLLATLLLLEMISSGSKQYSMSNPCTSMNNNPKLKGQMSMQEESLLTQHEEERQRLLHSDISVREVQRSNCYHCRSVVLTAAAGLILTVPVALITVLRNHLSSTSCQTILLLFNIALLFMTFFGFHALRLQCAEFKRKPISSDEWLLIFSNFIVGLIRMFNIAVYALALMPNSAGNAIFVVLDILFFVNSYSKTILIIQAHRFKRISLPEGTPCISVEKCFLILHIATFALWFASAFYDEILNFESPKVIDVYEYFFWKKVMDVLWPINVFYSFHAFMDLYGIYRRFRNTPE